jgi:cytochrome c biogenesis protein CcmG/thiol:disulfide interchange protein DsbE
VNFWASWCVPACVDEHPVLAAAQERYGEQLTIIGVLYQDAPADARAFLDRYGDAGYDHLVDEDGALAIEYGVTGPPETFFVDADGIVRHRQWGPLSDATMADQLAAILPAAAR